MLLVQEFIKTKTINDLYKTHGVEVSFSKDGALMALNYSQLEAKDSDKLACQCRGLILARKDNSPIVGADRISENVIVGETVIASYGFDRFFNEGQTNASVNYKDPNLKVYEKLDGTCVFVYFHNGWKTATRSTPEADIFIDDLKDHTFHTLFKKALLETINLSFEEYVKTLDKNVTYVFELTTPRNMIVVRYKDYRVTLLAARDKTTLKEFEIEDMENLVPKVKSYPLNTLNQIIEFVGSRPGFENEGVVVRDSNFKRVKIKSPEYGLLNRMRDKLGKSRRSLMELVLLEKEDDAIPFLPEDAVTSIQEIKEKVSAKIKYVDEKFAEYFAETNTYPYSDKVKRKTFAGFVTSREEHLQDIFFKMYEGKCKSCKDFINSKKNKMGEFDDHFLDKFLSAI